MGLPVPNFEEGMKPTSLGCWQMGAPDLVAWSLTCGVGSTVAGISPHAPSAQFCTLGPRLTHGHTLGLRWFPC